MTRNASDTDDGSIEYGNAVVWTAVLAISVVHNLVCMHVVAEYTEKWKSSHMLIFSLVLTEFFNLTMPMAIIAIMVVSGSKWNTTSCQFLLWSLLTFRVVVALHQAFLALDRVWFLKWPSAYRVHFAAHRSSKTVVFIWLLSTLAGFMPILGWEDTRNADVQINGECHILLSDMGLGYAISMEILLLLTLAVGTTCVIATTVGITFKSTRNSRRRRSNRIPSIVIESETGEITPAFDGTIDGRSNNQTCLLVCALVLVNYLVDGIPYVAINTYSLAHKKNSQWMSVAIIWCNLVRSLANPCLIQTICDRYRQGFLKTMGNRCCCLQNKFEETKTIARENSSDNIKSPDYSGLSNHNFLTEEYCDDVVPSRDHANCESQRITSTDAVVETVQGVTKTVATDKQNTNSTLISNGDGVLPEGADDTKVSAKGRSPAQKTYQKHKHFEGNHKKSEKLKMNGRRGEKLHTQGKDNFRDAFRLPVPTMESVEEESGESDSEGGSEGMYSAKDIAIVLDKEVVVEAQIEAVPSKLDTASTSQEKTSKRGSSIQKLSEMGKATENDEIVGKLKDHETNERECMSKNKDELASVDKKQRTNKNDIQRRQPQTITNQSNTQRRTNNDEKLIVDNKRTNRDNYVHSQVADGTRNQKNTTSAVRGQEKQSVSSAVHPSRRRVPLKDTKTKTIVDIHAISEPLTSKPTPTSSPKSLDTTKTANKSALFKSELKLI
ncbi:G protein-coupled receptor 161-like [Ptychodera flava]|uniref:G protein-coupled receptor 161-like n=1 Tax=Ptychodera flava TaxID=63121 RepID=UPI00396AA37A